MAAKARARSPPPQLPFSILEVHYEALRAAPRPRGARLRMAGVFQRRALLVRTSLASCEGARALWTPRADDAPEAVSELARLAALATPRHCPRAPPAPAELPALLSQALSHRPAASCTSGGTRNF